MGAAGGSGGKGGHGGYGGFSSMDSPPKKTSNLSSTSYNSEEAREILDGTLENRLQKKDLARILIEGTKTVYGTEKGEQVSAEFERLEKQPVYRRSAEELTAVVERVCDSSDDLEAEAKSIDDTVNHNYQPSAFKVALKGTLNLINKTRWYYPLVGMLPGKYQEKIAKKLGDNPIHYTGANIVTESIGVSILAGYLSSSLFTRYDGKVMDIWTELLVGLSLYPFSVILNCLRFRAINDSSKISEAGGSVLITFPYYLALAIEGTPKLLKKIGNTVKEVVVDSYSSAHEQLKEQEVQKRIELETQPSRISIEEAQSTAEAEEGEIETIQIKTKIVKHKKVSKSIKKDVD